jgi:hypothetical protein
VFLNNGNGTFRAPHSYGGSVAQSLAIGDLNGDGRPDLVTATGVIGRPGGVSVFLNRGDGSFGPKRDYIVGGGVIPLFGGPVSASVADLNGDGRPDLVTIDDDVNYSGVGVSVLLNRGDGSFGSRRDYRAGGDLASIAIGDLNGDGRPDLVAADRNLDGVSLFLNEGRGRSPAASGLSDRLPDRRRCDRRPERRRKAGPCHCQRQQRRRAPEQTGPLRRAKRPGIQAGFCEVGACTRQLPCVDPPRLRPTAPLAKGRPG